ncbi:MAG: SH3 domain-containing C40 family peptidase, partial [Clostridiales bacterium]|nr:SH3 domain-containing C40 family peptidase [Clostridiales bacterium]
SAAESFQNRSAVAGVTGAVSGYLRQAEMAEVSVLENDIVVTAAGQQEEQVPDEFGYRNLGIAHAEGNLNVREAPSTDASLVGKMPNDSACEILGVEGEWTKILSGEVSGYVKSEYLYTGEAAAIRAQALRQTVATVTTATLYVREAPTTESAIVTSMPMGEELEVLEVLEGWVRIKVDSDEGYVSADYVTISTELPKAMTMTEVRYGQGVSDVRVSLVSFATQFIGNPYVWGGTSLTRGADCSGFVLSVYANYGIYLPHSSRAQAGYGRSISASEAKPGDLFFYSSGSQINHVAIYIGNGQVVHASTERSGIKISSAYYRTPVKVVQILND